MADSSPRSALGSGDLSVPSVPNLHRLTCATTITKYTVFEEEK